MLMQISELAGLRRPASKLRRLYIVPCIWVEFCIAFDLRLPIGGPQAVTVWHCVALLVVA
jgi:hypothetical protein